MHRYGAGQERKQEKKEHCCVISANQFCFPFWVFSQITCLQLLFARKYKAESTVLARRNVAEGGAPGTPSSLVSCTSQSSLDIWSSWEAVCAATPCWGLILAGSMRNPTVTTLMNTEGFLPAVKNARPLGCSQRPGSLEALSDFPAAEVFCVTSILKTTSEQYGSDCSQDYQMVSLTLWLILPFFWEQGPVPHLPSIQSLVQVPREIPAALVLSEKQECPSACRSWREYSCFFYSNKWLILWSSLLS